MTEIQGQRPQDYVLAGSKTLERSGVGPARIAHAYAAASSLMQEEGPYGASDRLDHPYGWTVVDTTSMYAK